MVDRFINILTSLRLTVVCLCLSLVLVFVGTLAQVDLGLYRVQNEFFRSFFVYWSPGGGSLRIPVLPGGYLLGGVLLANLLAAHFKRFKLTKKKIGIFMIHIGIILLIVGQLLTDLLAHESVLHLKEGQTKSYSVTERESELAVIDPSDPDTDNVVAIPDALLAKGGLITHPALPFAINVKSYFPNSFVTNRPADAVGPPPATKGFGPELEIENEPRVTSMDFRDVPTGVIELSAGQALLGSWVVSEYFTQPQTVTFENKSYQLILRPKRVYRPYSIQLVKFTHAVYKGTETPKDFASLIRLRRPDTGEDREVRIYMNNPLRYAGETYYQQSFDKDDHGTVLQVVRNPSWLTPYFSCILVGAGLLVQFMSHLIAFARRTAAKAKAAGPIKGRARPAAPAPAAVASMSANAKRRD